MDLLSPLMSAHKTKCWHSHLTKKPEKQTKKCIFACCHNTFQRAENTGKPFPRAFAVVETSSLCSLSVVGWQPPQVQWVSLVSSKHKQRKRVWVGHVVLFYFIYFFHSCGFLASPQTWVIKAAGRSARLLVCLMSTVQWKHQEHEVQMCNARLDLDSPSMQSKWETNQKEKCLNVHDPVFSQVGNK